MIPRIGYSVRLFLIYFLIIGGLAWFIVSKALDTLGSSVSQSAEEILVDTANLVAEMIGQQAVNGEIRIDPIRKLVPAYLDRRLDAQIYEVLKEKPDLQLYVTDRNGIVLFDSTGQSEGEDFSEWRDVWFTLKGLYGARSSPLDANLQVAPPDEKALYIAAPIRSGNEIIGVVTVSKAVRRLGPFISSANRSMIDYALLVLVISLLFGGLMTWWFAKSIRKLVSYADDLGAGKKVKRPAIREREFSRLAQSMEQMQRELEGKEYVENYIHSMAHEMKSPLTGIQGATELLQEEMPETQRQKFIGNIRDSAQRMTALVERLLALAAVEKRREPQNVESFDLADAFERLATERQSRIDDQGLQIVRHIPAGFSLLGEKLLLEQAIGNLLDNAIDFSPTGGVISISAQQREEWLELCVDDQGPGIPEYAKARLFERFFSLPRPHSQKRSTGLGLSFVREVVGLHGGEVDLESRESGGTRARIRLPASPTG